MTKARKQKTVITVISKIAERTYSKDACLVIIYGHELGKKYDLQKEQILIGRSVECDLAFDQESVSRRHAKIVNAYGETVLSDLGSTNGTYVNNELVDQKTLHDGDLLKIGRTVLKYFAGANLEASYHEEIHRMTAVDGLTQVYNRRHFHEQLEREIFRARRYRRDLSIVLFDLDGFSSLNRDYGHIVGDAVLIELAQLVERRSRLEDVVARLERDRFGILLPETNHENAGLLAERIRRLVLDHDFLFEGTAIHVTMGFGVASLVNPELDADRMTKLAVDNLEQAKKQGGNVVVL